MDQFVQTSYSDETGGGHAVVLTGYQDYGDHGYWKLLNSWGAPDNRPNGFFYIDMYMDYSAKYPNDIQAMYFEVVDLKTGQSPPEPSSMNLTLLQGWNLISTPKTLRPGNDTYAIFSGVDSDGHSMYTYDPVSGWVKIEPSYQWKPLQGVWIYANTTTTIPFFIPILSVHHLPGPFIRAGVPSGIQELRRYQQMQHSCRFKTSGIT